ncbi:3'-5' exonuclease [Pseudonocardia sp. HH130630-07]|uniref:3'-5' exonuclease n=1 Tax=Pseudonocardia sp. HH130630-07 TaxID=1690815 RepID=UPI0018D3661D|nr:3'-5' exonuclease [Pseudonocardia sp. HH130630-07]
MIDFEYTTPTGAAPEPIEVAVQTLRVEDGRLRRAWAYEALIRPPAHAPVTGFDTQQTGITAAMVADRPAAAEVLAELDDQLRSATNGGAAAAGVGPAAGGPLVLVAHHAHAEARILSDWREHCPTLARTDLIDTVRLARDRFPELPKHGLDVLAAHMRMPAPPGRHRAMPDVQLLVDVFCSLVEHEVRWPDLRTLRAVANVPARAADTEQEALF